MKVVIRLIDIGYIFGSRDLKGIVEFFALFLRQDKTLG